MSKEIIMKSIDQIQAVLKANQKELHARFGINSLSIFGSVVRGDAYEESDVDILASFDRPTGLIKLISAENYLKKLLGEKVDLIPREEVRTELKERILSESVPV